MKRREVRKQTCDLITLLEMAQPLSHYYLFMEDDFRCAPQGLKSWSGSCSLCHALPLQPALLVCQPVQQVKCLKAENLCRQLYGSELCAKP